MTTETEQPENDHQLEDGRVKLKTRNWYLRTFTQDEHGDGMSAARLAASRIRNNKRLVAIGGDIEAEARRISTANYTLYLLPLLIQDKQGVAVFDVEDAASMAEFEALEAEVLNEIFDVFWSAVCRIRGER